jgi:hypothetical protein
MGSYKAKFGPKSIRELKHSQDMARDSLSSYLKDRTLALRLTTLEMGKKSKQKLKRKVSQSPCFFSIVQLYHFLALSFKEKEKSFHIKVPSDMPSIQRRL